MEQTFVVLKPDCLRRGLVGRVIQRLEDKGLLLIQSKVVILRDIDIDFLYWRYKDRDFYSELTEFMKSGPCMAMIWEGLDSVGSVLRIAGIEHEGTNPLPGTIRGDFATSVRHNVIYASESFENAAREINFFTTFGITYSNVS